MQARDALSWAGRVAMVLSLGFGLGLSACGDDDGGAPDASMDSGGSGGDAGTGGGGTGGTGGGGTGGSGGTGGVTECVAPQPNQPPDFLSCAGLYSNIANKTIAPGVREFAPGVQLWSDGAVKKRWILLPEGETVDVSDENNWRFPIGTKFFKEFKWGDKLVETRLFWKVSATFWVRTSYRWNDAETEAEPFAGDIEVDGDPYHIPSATECDQCHGGRPDKALGFEAILLSLPGATGLTVDMLKADDLLSGGTIPDNIAIGDDGTGEGSEALGWLHVNCGVSCHNGYSGSNAYHTGLRMKLMVDEADGSPTADVDARTLTRNVMAVTGAWNTRMRIVPGEPENSLLYDLMSTRDPINMEDQMPPIATRLVPTAAAAQIHAWITAMSSESLDGGVDSGTDASADPDAGAN